jgi:hypothetical protein
MVVKHGEAQVDFSLMLKMLYRMVKYVPIMLAKVPGELLGGGDGERGNAPNIHNGQVQDHSMMLRSGVANPAIFIFIFIFKIMLNRDFDHYYGEAQSGSFCYTGKKSTMEWSSPLPIMLGESPRQAELDQS